MEFLPFSNPIASAKLSCTTTVGAGVGSVAFFVNAGSLALSGLPKRSFVLLPADGVAVIAILVVSTLRFLLWPGRKRNSNQP
jgi:hypothetical protein